LGVTVHPVILVSVPPVAYALVVYLKATVPDSNEAANSHDKH